MTFTCRWYITGVNKLENGIKIFSKDHLDDPPTCEIKLDYFWLQTSLFGRGERHCTTTQKPSAWLWTMVECIILELLWYLGVWTCNHHQGTMNWKLHEEILQGNFRAAVHGLKFRRGGLMSQDNKPKDTCVSTTEWLKAKNLIFSYSCFFDLPSHYFSENRLWAEA